MSVLFAVLALATGTASVAPVAASARKPPPQAEISILSGRGPLNVAFVASSAFFPSPVITYKWSFGDGSTRTSPHPLVNHTYAHTGVYHVQVVESDSAALTAVGTGILGVFQCSPSGVCTESSSSGAITQIQVSGPTATTTVRAMVDLFGGPFQISHCQSRIVPTAAIADSTFSGNLIVTVRYNSSDVSATPTTCFQSEVPFVDAAGKMVKSGPLPTCAATLSKAPCLQAYSISGTHVTKTVIIPPGDPKVGAP